MNNTMRFFSITILFFCFFSHSYSQIDVFEKQDRFYMGLKTGLNLSMHSQGVGKYGDQGSDEFNQSIHSGVVFGLHSNIRLSSLFALQIETLFTQKGGLYRQENNSITIVGGNGSDKAYDVKAYRLEYIEFPVLASFNLDELLNLRSVTNTHFRFSAGLAYAINVGSVFKYNEFRATSSNTVSEVDENFFKEPFDYAENSITNLILDLRADVRYALDLPLFFNMRWERTLSGVYSIAELNGNNMKTNIGTVSLGAGVIFQ